MARALGTTPDDAQADGIDRLAAHLSGSVVLLFTDRDPAAVIAYLKGISEVDFARAGAIAPRDFTVPPGPVMSTGGEVPAEDDVPIAAGLEPELRRLGVPTRLLHGKVVLGGEDGSDSIGYTVCRAGDVLDGRQTRLLKMFSVCLSEFRVRVLAYWTTKTGIVTEVDPRKEDGEGSEVTDENE
jgi:hypothetical protein